MRTLITFIILSLISHLAVGQKNFEGKITYKYADSTTVSKTEIFFGKQKLKIKVKAFIEWDPYTMITITDFENGIIYHVNEGYKIYYKEPIASSTKDSLKILKPIPSKNKKIYNYSCSAYQSCERETEKKNEYIKPYQTFMWYADSLYYIVDKKNRDIYGIEYATDGTNVCLGWATSRQHSIIENLTEPLSISVEQISDSILSIPLDFREVTEDEMFEKVIYNGDIMDEEMMEFKRSLPPPYFPRNLPPPPPKQKSKKSSPKNTHNQPTKSSAIKPKQ